MSKNVGDLCFIPVSERCDDKTFGAAQELVHVVEFDIRDANQTPVLVLFEVETSLLEPLEVEHRLDVHLHLFVETKYGVMNRYGFQFGRVGGAHIEMVNC